MKRSHGISVNLVRQGKHKFYSLTIPSDVLARTCFVSTRDEDPKLGFQRLLDKNRAQQIADYIDKGLGTIPSAVILSAQTESELKLINKGKTLQFTENPRAFLVLDGQHRIYGFSLAKTDVRIPVVIYEGLDRKEESRIFIDINTKQKPVPNELLLDIKSLAQYESDSEKILNEIFTFFHQESRSPLFGLTTSSTKVTGKISRPTFYAAYRPILKIVSNRDPWDVYSITSMYLFASIKGLRTKNLERQITNTIVFKAIISVFPVFAQRVKERFKEYSEDGFDEIVMPVYSRLKENKISNPGLSYISLANYLNDTFNSDFTL